MNKSPIQWTDYTTQLIRFRDVVSGDVLNHCEKVSPGCRLCYAERITRRWKGANRLFTPAGGRGLEAFVDDKKLREVAGTRRRGMCFVEDMSDLFGDWSTDAMLDQCFAAFALSGLTIQILTKRAARMRAYLNGPDVRDRVSRAARELVGLDVEALSELEARGWIDGPFCPWPLLNVWVGVSVENQRLAEERVPHLLEAKAAVRFVSYEPALGPVRLDRLYIADELELDALRGQRNATVQHMAVPPVPCAPAIDWVIFGGESGNDAEPCSLQWARSMRDHCKAAGVAFFMKQGGRYPFERYLTARELVEGGKGIKRPPGQELTEEEADRIAASGKDRIPLRLPWKDSHGGDPAEWPEDLRGSRAWPKSTIWPSSKASGAAFSV